MDKSSNDIYSDLKYSRHESARLYEKLQAARMEITELKVIIDAYRNLCRSPNGSEIFREAEQRLRDLGEI